MAQVWGGLLQRPKVEEMMPQCGQIQSPQWTAMAGDSAVRSHQEKSGVVGSSAMILSGCPNKDRFGDTGEVEFRIFGGLPAFIRREIVASNTDLGPLWARLLQEPTEVKETTVLHQSPAEGFGGEIKRAALAGLRCLRRLARAIVPDAVRLHHPLNPAGRPAALMQHGNKQGITGLIQGSPIARRGDTGAGDGKSK
jgi:hypothetical protein